MPMARCAKKRIPEEERFFSKVTKVPGGCWVFTGCTANKGYGQFVSNGRTVKAHRWSWENANGPIPSGMVIDHLCRNRACVNPDHLEPVTDRVNILRGVAPTAENAAKTRCGKGHPFSPENTYRYPDGRRECRECSRERKREWRAKRVGKCDEAQG